MAAPSSLVALGVLLFAAASASAYDFEVGGGHGWVVPPSNNSRVYNQWASKNRFRTGDNLLFKYKKDSVIVVTEEEYDRCNSQQPISFYNNGNTEIKLDHAGTYYFISGLREHCDRGQKMIVRVMGQPEGPQSSPSGGGGGQAEMTPPADKSGGGAPRMSAPSAAGMLVFFSLIPFF